MLGSHIGVHMLVDTYKACQTICIRSLYIIQMFVFIQTLKLKLEVENSSAIYPTFSELFYQALYFGVGTPNHLTVMGHPSALKVAYLTQGFQHSTYMSCPFLMMVNKAQVEQFPLYLATTYTKTDIFQDYSSVQGQFQPLRRFLE